MNREMEFKLSVHASFVVPDLHENGLPYELQEGPTKQLRSIYFDTTDLRLARMGATLRHRTGEPGAPWTLKLPIQDLDLMIRDEYLFEGKASTVPEAARDLIIAFIRSADLEPVARLSTRRRSWSVLTGDDEIVAEIDDDEVSILEGRRVVARFREVEIESKGASADELIAIRDALVQAGAVLAEPIPKAVRALGPRATAAPDIPLAQPAAPDDPASKALRASIVSAVKRIITHDPPTRLGDAEGVHQMRVGARRLRSDLQTFKPIIDPGWVASLNAELKWLASVLGEVRDLDVLTERLHHAAEEIGVEVDDVFASFDVRRAEARQELLDALRSNRYKQLLESLIEACQAPPLTELGREPSFRLLPKRVKDPWSKLERDARRLRHNNPDEDFHDVRIRAKRARYAAETAARVLSRKDAVRFVQLVTEVQDILGTHQDAHLAKETLRSFAEASTDKPQLAFALGRLYEHQSQQAAVMKERFFRVWERLDRKKNVGWMNA